MSEVDYDNNFEKWLINFSTRVNDQYILSRNSQQNTHQWVISLSLALITTVLTIGGNKKPYPSEYSFIAVLAALPLMFRFFVRSCLETCIQYRWKVIRDTIEKYLYVQSIKKGDVKPHKQYLLEIIDLYYFKWKAPEQLSKIVWDNFRLAYLWPFIVIISLIIWGFCVLPFTKPICLALIIVFSFMVYELISFITYEGFEYAEINIKKP